MARQEAQSKLLYYPTSDQVIDLVATWLTNPTHSRLADPSVGEGQVLARLKSALDDCETWGVELSYSRVQKAQRVIGVVLPASFYHVKWADRTVSLCLSNPPYDYSDYRDERGRHIRHERLFVMGMTRCLVPSGIHLIPRAQLLDEELARHITGWYERVLVFGYPQSQFDQVVLFAVKRPQYAHPTRVQVEGLMAWGNSDAALTELVSAPNRWGAHDPTGTAGGSTWRFCQWFGALTEALQESLPESSQQDSGRVCTNDGPPSQARDRCVEREADSCSTSDPSSAQRDLRGRRRTSPGDVGRRL